MSLLERFIREKKGSVTANAAGVILRWSDDRGDFGVLVPAADLEEKLAEILDVATPKFLEDLGFKPLDSDGTLWVRDHVYVRTDLGRRAVIDTATRTAWVANDARWRRVGGGIWVRGNPADTSYAFDAVNNRLIVTRVNRNPTKEDMCS